MFILKAIKGIIGLLTHTVTNFKTFELALFKLGRILLYSCCCCNSRLQSYLSLSLHFLYSRVETLYLNWIKFIIYLFLMFSFFSVKFLNIGYLNNHFKKFKSIQIGHHYARTIDCLHCFHGFAMFLGWLW